MENKLKGFQNSYGRENTRKSEIFEARMSENSFMWKNKVPRVAKTTLEKNKGKQQQVKNDKF